MKFYGTESVKQECLRLCCIMLAWRATFPYLEVMEVRITREQEARLAEIAEKAGTDAAGLAKDVLTRYLDDEARFMAAVEKGLAAAAREDFIEEEEMDARVERMFRS